MSDTQVIPGATDRPPAGERADGPPVRDLAMTALILGVAGLAWFGWGQSGLAEAGALPLQAGSAAGLAAAVAGGVLLRRHRAGGSAMSDARVRRGYWKVVATEVIAIVAGNAALGAADRPAYVPAWTLLVVGVHFLPLARLFGAPVLTTAGLVLAAAAAGAAAAGAAAGVRPSLVAGIAGGVVCVACAALCLREAADPGARP
jgi:hypothetical protein